MATWSRSTMSAIASTGPRPISPRAGKPALSASLKSLARTSRPFTGDRPGSRAYDRQFPLRRRAPALFLNRDPENSRPGSSAVRGLYRQFTLIYVVADERDPIRLRTNYRKGEEVYLYRTAASPGEARERFLEYVNTLNTLHTQPRWYNAITTNCTTAIRAQHPVNQRTPWDWRILLNGKGDELLYERHLIATAGLPFPELKERSHINERARAADQDPDFSRRIREGVPGFLGD